MTRLNPVVGVAGGGVRVTETPLAVCWPLLVRMKVVVLVSPRRKMPTLVVWPACSAKPRLATERQEPAEQTRLVPQDWPSVTLPNTQAPVTVLQVFTLHAVVDAGQPIVMQLVHAPLEHANPAAQSALVAQVVLQVVPPAGHMKLPAQECGTLKWQLPAPLQVPGS